MLKPKGLIQGLNWYLEMARGTGLMVMDQAKTCHGKVSKCREMGVGRIKESWDEKGELESGFRKVYGRDPVGHTANNIR